MPRKKVERKHFETPQAAIEYRLRNTDLTDVDLETIFDKDAMQAVYDDIGSIDGLGEALGLAPSCARDLLRIHGIQAMTPGGYRGDPDIDEGFFKVADPFEIMKDVGHDYTQRQRDMMVIGIHTDSCFLECPMYGRCWDAPGGHHKKRDDCLLYAHVRLTLGVTNGH